MKPGFSDYLREAFNARPLGLLVPPNWIGLAAFGLLGVVNPGFWLIGAGVEAAYLLGLSHLPRFRSLVEGKYLSAASEQSEQYASTLLDRLDKARRARFLTLRKKCESILSEQKLEADSSVRQIQADGLGRLLSIYLQLLLTQANMEKLLGEGDLASVMAKLERVREELDRAEPLSDLHGSLQGQITILEKRQHTLEEASEKLAFTESELDRIEHQAALIRDEVSLSAAPETVGSQIDRVSGELSETSRWISDQQKLFGDNDLDNTITVPLNPPISQS